MSGGVSEATQTIMKRIIHLPGRSARAVITISAAICGVLFTANPAPGAGNDRPAIDPRADEWLKRMGQYLAEAKMFSVKAEVWQDIDLSSGQRVQAGRELQFQVRRPNRLHVEVRSTRRNRDLIFDGSAIVLMNRAENFYGKIPTKGGLDEVLDTASDRFGISMPLDDFLRSDPYKDLREKVTAARDIGPITVIGTRCEHLVFSQDNLDWQVWIEEGARPVPRKFVITYKDEPNSPQFTAIFSDWDFTTPLPDFVFKFEPPPGAAQIEVTDIKARNEAKKPISQNGGK
jgi:hypothetical protein